MRYRPYCSRYQPCMTLYTESPKDMVVIMCTRSCRIYTIKSTFNNVLATALAESSMTSDSSNVVANLQKSRRLIRSEGCLWPLVWAPTFFEWIRSISPRVVTVGRTGFRTSGPYWGTVGPTNRGASGVGHKICFLK